MEQQPLFELTPYIDENAAESLNIFSTYLGEEAAEKIIASLGGQDLRVPATEKGLEYENLLEKLGAELTSKFIEIFGGEMIYVPLDYSLKLDDRNKKIRQKIVELVEQGKSSASAMKTVADEFKISQRSVRRIYSE